MEYYVIKQFTYLFYLTIIDIPRQGIDIREEK